MLWGRIPGLGESKAGQHGTSENFFLGTGRDESPNGIVVNLLTTRAINALLHAYHNLYVHTGYHGLLNRIGSAYYWPNLAQRIKDFLADCHSCQLGKPQNKPHQAEFTLWKPDDINQVVAMDFQGPYHVISPDGSKYILTVIDLFDGWCMYIPVISTTTEIGSSDF